jgi:carboxymethylenebutenolidase
MQAMSWTEVSTPDGPMRVFEAHPTEEPKGAVIVVQEAFGVNDYIADVVRDLAEEGWHSAAPELFHRSGPASVAPYDDFSKVLPLYEPLSDATVLADVDATIDLMHRHGFADSAIGIVGFCWGGRVTLLVSLRRQLGAGVGFYGGGIVHARFPQFPPLIDEVGSLKTPWLGLFGDQDQSIPVEDVEALRQALDQSAPVDHEIVRYPGAGHGFHCQARPAAYNAEAALDGWRRATDWFDRHLKKA